VHVGRRRRDKPVAEEHGRVERRGGDDAADSAERVGQRRAAVTVRVHSADIRRVPSHEEALSVQRHHVALLRRREARQQSALTPLTSGLCRML